MTTSALQVIEQKTPGRHEIQAQFIELRSRGFSYAKIAKQLKVSTYRPSSAKPK